MLHTISVWLVVVAFFAAGLFNTIGTSATRQNFVRWGYPSWWHRATGVLEVATALLIAAPISRVSGLILGAAIIATAVWTVLRHRDLSHLTPLGVFFILITLAGVTS